MARGLEIWSIVTCAAAVLAAIVLCVVPVGGTAHAQEFKPVWNASTVYAGAIVQNRGDGQFHEIAAQEFTVGGVKGVRHSYPQNGLWVGDRIEFSLFDGAWGFAYEGWLRIPTSNHTHSKYFGADDAVGAQRTWSTDTEGWYSDACVLFSWAPDWRIGGWSQINGFRWQRFEQTLHDPDPAFGSLIAAWESPNDRVDIRADYFIPYIGIQIENHDRLVGGLGRVIVSPIVFGSFFHREAFAGANLRMDEGTLTYSHGYFFEFMMEGDYRQTPDLRFGGFLKLSGLNLYGEGTVETTGQVAASGTYDLVHRNLAYVGGLKAEYAFNTPVMELLP